MWLKILGAAIALVGTIFIFDARRIVRTSFAFGEENMTTLGMKIFGMLMAFAGGFLAIL